MTAIIRTEALTKSYGSHRGIVEVDLEVNEGEVFGFLGPNGAGKTTTIRTVLDLIRPTSGKAFVFGIESTEDPIAIHKRIGYVPGEFTLYDRLTGGQHITYFANLRGGVDPAYQASLIERFDVDPSRKFKEYSKGNKQKIGLVIALQHRPELLILDEPTAGLDPLMERTFRQCMIESKRLGQTVFLSSHILSEVEAVCDRVGILRDGELLQLGTLAELRHLSALTIHVTFDGPPPDLRGVPGVNNVVVDGQRLSCELTGPIGPLLQALAPWRVHELLSAKPSLEELFLSHYGPDGGRA